MSRTHSSHTSKNTLWSLVVCSVFALGRSFHATFPPILQTSATNPSFWTSVKTHVYTHKPINAFAAADLPFPHTRAFFFWGKCVMSALWPAGGLVMLPTGHEQNTAARPDKTTPWTPSCRHWSLFDIQRVD